MLNPVLLQHVCQLTHDAMLDLTHRRNTCIESAMIVAETLRMLGVRASVHPFKILAYNSWVADYVNRLGWDQLAIDYPGVALVEKAGGRCRACGFNGGGFVNNLFDGHVAAMAGPWLIDPTADQFGFDQLRAEPFVAQIRLPVSIGQNFDFPIEGGGLTYQASNALTYEESYDKTTMEFVRDRAEEIKFRASRAVLRKAS
jgi:hypothetical protein